MTKEEIEKMAKAGDRSRRRFVKDNLNKLVLDTDRVYLLVGLAEDEDDIYWRLKSLHGEETWSSCVGRIYPLKNCLPSKTYRQINRWFKMNDCTQFMSETELKDYKNKFKGTILI